MIILDLPHNLFIFYPFLISYCLWTRKERYSLKISESSGKFLAKKSTPVSITVGPREYIHIFINKGVPYLRLEGVRVRGYECIPTFSTRTVFNGETRRDLN